MTQPADEGELVVLSPYLDAIPQNPGGKSALQMNDSKFRELTEAELAEMEAGDDEGGMDAEEIDAFLGAELPGEEPANPPEPVAEDALAAAGFNWRSLKAKRQKRDEGGQFDDGGPSGSVLGPLIEGADRARLLNQAGRVLAAKLNGGGRLDPEEPAERQLQEAIDQWAMSTHASLADEINAAIRDPEADTRGAALLRAVASADPDSPVLYRGMADIPAAQVPREGQEMDLGPTSFTEDALIADGFTRHQYRAPTSQVFVTVRPNSRAVRIDRHGPAREKGLAERIGMGRYRVVARRESTAQYVPPFGGRSTPVPRYDIELEQIA